MQHACHIGPVEAGGHQALWYYEQAEPGVVPGGRGPLESLDLAKRIVELAEEKQATDIVLLDIRPITIVADYFVICGGSSERQIRALASDVVETVKREAGLSALHNEGSTDSGWVLLDYGDVVVHIFAPAEREYYRLEELWGSAVPVLQIH